jgi:serine protease Do
LASCAGNKTALPEDAVPDYASMKLEALRTLSVEDPGSALEAVGLLSSPVGGYGQVGARTPPDLAIGTEALAEIARAAATTLAQGSRRALEASDYRAATRILASIQTLSDHPGIVPGIDRIFIKSLMESSGADNPGLTAGLLLARAEAFRARGLYAPAMNLYLTSLRSAPEDPDPAALHAPRSSSASTSGGKRFDAPSETAQLLSWSSLALEARDREALRTLKPLLEARGLVLPEGAENLLSSSETMATMLTGVVTVRVDRGIKLQNGLGLPDRVLGSGFYVDRSGYILTNYHVVSSEVDPTYEGYSRLTILPSEDPDRRIAARVVAWDEKLDLALLKADVRAPFVFSLSAPRDAQAGQRIYAMGSPVGLENSITSGIVSAVGRRILPKGEAVQVDAPLNPGNSGGPMVDESGELLGIVFAGLPSYQGLSFALGAKWIQAVLPCLFDGGELEWSWLGFALSRNGRGFLEISYVHPQTPRGPWTGMELRGIGASRLDGSMGSAQTSVLSSVPGSLVVVRLEDGLGARTVLRLLRKMPAAPLETASRIDRKEALLPVAFGLEMERLSAGTALPGKYTVRKVLPGGSADEAGISEGDSVELRKLEIDQTYRAMHLYLVVKKRSAGFLESLMMLEAPLDTADFL